MRLKESERKRQEERKRRKEKEKGREGGRVPRREGEREGRQEDRMEGRKWNSMTIIYREQFFLLDISGYGLKHFGSPDPSYSL